jgi:hypothetical protein
MEESTMHTRETNLFLLIEPSMKSKLWSTFLHSLTCHKIRTGWKILTAHDLSLSIGFFVCFLSTRVAEQSYYCSNMTNSWLSLLYLFSVLFEFRKRASKDLPSKSWISKLSPSKIRYANNSIVRYVASLMELHGELSRTK